MEIQSGVGMYIVQSRVRVEYRYLGLSTRALAKKEKETEQKQIHNSILLRPTPLNTHVPPLAPLREALILTKWTGL